MPDIYLRPGAANPSDVVLRDPTLSDQIGGEITGSLDVTLGALTLSSTGQVAVAGNLAQTFGAMTLAGVGTVDVIGQLASTLGAMTLVATGTAVGGEIQGALDVHFDDMTLIATGTVGVTEDISLTQQLFFPVASVEAEEEVLFEDMVCL